MKEKSGSDSNFREVTGAAPRADGGNRSLAPISHLQPEFEAWKARYPAGCESSLVLPCVRRIQEDRGYVADEDIQQLAAYLGVPQIQIEEVLSFYTMFRRRPIGRWHLQFCHNVSCSMNGAESILAHVERKLGLAPG